MIRSLLHPLRRRLLLQGFCNALAYLALGAAGVILVIAATHPLPAHILAMLALYGGLAAGILATGWTCWKRPTLAQVAQQIDRRAGTHDRLATALAFEHPATPIHAAALTECETFLARFDGKKYTPWTVPRPLPWLLAPILSIALLQLRTEHATYHSPPRLPDQAVLDTATQLEQMAKRIETKPKDQSAADLQQVAEALKRSASHLRADATGEQPAKATLRELSTLEELLQTTQQGNALDALGNALGKVDDAKDAAEALKKHDPLAAKKLEQLGKRLVEGKNKERPLKQLEKAMADAASQLGENSGMGSAASQAASAARSGDAAGTAEALSRLGQAVKNSKESSGGGGSSGKSQQMQAMISQLQEMKSGKEGESQTPTGGPGEANKQKGASGPVTVAMGSQPKPKQGEKPSNGIFGAQGKPGGEHDQGTKLSALGTGATGTVEQPGVQSQLNGAPGAGESVRSLVPGAPGAEPAKVGYKALYEAAQPAAEDALAHQNIPIGSRLFVKRYFESIRPKQ